MYKVNPTAYGSVFVLPADVVDRHLKLAGSAQLKVLLWFYRHASGAASDMGSLVKFMGLPKADVLDAIQYWLDCGLIVEEGGEPPVSEAPAIKAAEPEPAKPVREAPAAEPSKPNPAYENGQKTLPLPELPVVKPTMKQIAIRAGESEAVRTLFLEAQNILGRTIGFDAQSSLLMLHDHYGLPAEVILMLCQYARTHNKQNSMTYILKFGKDWAEREIDTFDKAEAQLEQLEKSNKAWLKLKTLAGISTPLPTMAQQKFLAAWVGGWGFSVDMIYMAYEEMAENTGKLSFSYINKILNGWHDLGLKTPEDVEAYKESRRQPPPVKKPKEALKKEGKKSSGLHGRSYDLDEAERRARYEPIIYKKSRE